MGTGVNKLRYAYYCSFEFFYFLGGVTGAGTAVLFVTLYVQFTFLPIPFVIAISGLAGCFLTLLLLKTFFCMASRPFLLAGVVGGLVALCITCGLAWVILPTDVIYKVAGGILLAVVAGLVMIQLAGAKRIKIYPDRVMVGKLVLYYRDMKVVKWGVGSLERTKQELTPAQQSKPLEVLTPLLFESRGKDFSISYYYAVIEMPANIYVVQPVFWRNSLAQNVRNGWLEAWRWDGATEAPAGWVRPA